MTQIPVNIDLSRNKMLKYKIVEGKYGKAYTTWLSNEFLDTIAVSGYMKQISYTLLKLKIML